jgi:hypothetical protein
MTMMDNETGEVLVPDTHIGDCSKLDLETGEFEFAGIESDGEGELNHRSRTAVRKSKFNVPRSYLQQTDETQNDENSRCYLSSHESFSLADKKRVIDLKEVRVAIAT